MHLGELMNHFILSGRELRTGDGLANIPDVAGDWRFWLPTKQVESLFKKDAKWLLERLTQGKEALRGHHLMYEQTARFLEGSLRLVLTLRHTLSFVEMENFQELHRRIAVLACGDLSDEDGTNEIIDGAVFEVTIYSSPEHDARAEAERKQRCLPLQPGEGVTDPELKRFEADFQHKLDAAKRVGIERILATLPPRPGPRFQWVDNPGYWTPPVSWDPSNRFKGVDDPDF